MKVIEIPQKIWAISTLVLIIVAGCLVYWSFDIKDDLHTAQNKIVSQNSYIKTLTNNIEEVRSKAAASSLVYLAQVDSLQKENKLLTLKLSIYSKNIADIHKKYDKIYTKIDASDDFDQQFKYTQELLSIHGQLFHPRP